MRSFSKQLPQQLIPERSVWGIPCLKAQMSGSEETSLRCMCIAHVLCCSAKTSAVSKCIAHFLQKPAAIFLCRLCNPSQTSSEQSELSLPVSARALVEHVPPCPGCSVLPSWLPELSKGLFWWGSPAFYFCRAGK